MAVVKCANGHFYDDERFKECPYCDTSPDVTTTQPVVDIPPESDVTVGYYGGFSELTGKKPPARGKFVGPVVGWVVVIDGAYKGVDFPLKTGKNFIGRNPTNDVCLDLDKTISRERHAVIVYEPKTNAFLALPGEASELFYLNDEVVLSPQSLKPYDVITVGKTHMVFVSLCNESFHWVRDDEEEKVASDSDK